MAIDGVQIDVPDATDNAEVFERGLSNRGMDTPFPGPKLSVSANAARTR
ncbi:hypothetical protein JWS13_01975 (plasmid) [Rhodococcus pseudokoreensis]|uniref:Uncharacterized protein n=1 Tax=Rhodococcus pseudokoreensis TaxID=2811421 RepID=A0A974VZ56_9NOCA|nr:hypothetical protein [Rhodococcus pseudokoreensis]QSE87423.1 hypothetical protein JWS13_01975 [Rhodococcus pseudokoreensis]